MDEINFDDDNSEQSTDDGHSEDEPADEGVTGSVGDCNSESEEVAEDIYSDESEANNVTTKLKTAVKIDDCPCLLKFI